MMSETQLRKVRTVSEPQLRMMRMMSETQLKVLDPGAHSSCKSLVKVGQASYSYCANLGPHCYQTHSHYSYHSCHEVVVDVGREPALKVFLSVENTSYLSIW